MCPHEITEEYSKTATEAVGDKLRIKDFIDRHSQQILDSLQESAEELRDENEESFRRAFIEKTLPIIDSVIHVGSSRVDYLSALAWARKTHAEPDKWLTLLTFVYIVCREIAERPRENIWEKIRYAVEGLIVQELEGQRDIGGPHRTQP